MIRSSSSGARRREQSEGGKEAVEVHPPELAADGLEVGTHFVSRKGRLGLLVLVGNRTGSELQQVVVKVELPTGVEGPGTLQVTRQLVPGATAAALVPLQVSWSRCSGPVWVSVLARAASGKVLNDPRQRLPLPRVPRLEPIPVRPRRGLVQLHHHQTLGPSQTLARELLTAVITGLGFRSERVRQRGAGTEHTFTATSEQGPFIIRLQVTPAGPGSVIDLTLWAPDELSLAIVMDRLKEELAIRL